MSVQKIELYLLHPGQSGILENKKRFNVVCCGRRWGKSKLSVNLLCEPALEGFPTGYFTPTYKLLKETYNDCIAALDAVIIRKSDQEFIELATGGIIDFWTMDNPFAGRSRKYKRAIVDEAAFAKSLTQSWNEAIRPTLTDYEGDAFFFSTPKGKNDFYDFYLNGIEGKPGWACWRKTSYENPFIKKSEIESAKADIPSLAFEQEYMAEFNANVANPFGLPYIDQCTYPISREPAVCFGVDLAKSHDWTVIIGLDKNGSVCHFDRFQKDWKSTLEALRALPPVPVKLDSTGVGDPIVEDFQRIRGNILGFKFSAHSKQQIMEGLAVAIQKRLITFPDGDITRELSNYEYEYTNTGVRYSCPKGHDDCVCALALAWDLHKSAVTSGIYSWA